MTANWLPGRGSAIICLSVFIFLPLAIHEPIWSGHVDFFPSPASDLSPYVYGLKTFQYQSIHQFGELPLWNPHLLLGQPVAGNIQNALFYPLNVLFWIFPFFTALWIGQVLHMALAGYGARLHRSRRHRPGLVGHGVQAVAVGLGAGLGCASGHAEHGAIHRSRRTALAS